MSEERAPAFQFYPADYLADENVAAMCLESEGGYIRLMAYCWREGSIPDDVAKLAKLCRVPLSRMKKLWAEIAPCFEPHTSESERLVHPRLEAERAKQAARRKALSEAGHRGGSAPRREKPGSSQEAASPSLSSAVAVAVAVPASGQPQNPPAADEPQQPAPLSRATRLPTGWAPKDNHRTRAATEGLDVEREAEKFKQHATATGRTLKNWDAGFTTWLLRAGDYGGKNGGGSGGNGNGKHAPTGPAGGGGGAGGSGSSAAPRAPSRLAAGQGSFSLEG